jgi:hypothetical protein
VRRAHAQIDLLNVRALILGSIEPEPLAQLSDLASRFVGHPIRHEVITLLTPADALPEDPVEGLRAALEDDKDNWRTYRKLATLLINRDGDYGETTRVFLG